MTFIFFIHSFIHSDLIVFFKFFSVFGNVFVNSNHRCEAVMSMKLLLSHCEAQKFSSTQMRLSLTRSRLCSSSSSFFSPWGSISFTELSPDCWKNVSLHEVPARLCRTVKERPCVPSLSRPSLLSALCVPAETQTLELSNNRVSSFPSSGISLISYHGYQHRRWICLQGILKTF